MAMGIPGYDPRLDMANMQLNSQLLQNLGNQLRQDVQTIQTNRQLQGFTQGLQGVTPQSPDFTQKMVGLMSQYPKAVNSPIGKAAISQLGTEHEYWQRQQLSSGRRFTAIPGTNAILDNQTGSTTMLPEGARPEKPIVFETPTGGAAYNPRTGEPILQVGDPFAEETPAIKLEKLRQQNRIDLQKLKDLAPPKTSTSDPISKALEKTYSSSYGKAISADALAAEAEAKATASGAQADIEAAAAARAKAATVAKQATVVRDQLEARMTPIERLKPQAPGIVASAGAGIPGLVDHSIPTASIPAASGVVLPMPAGNEAIQSTLQPPSQALAPKLTDEVAAAALREAGNDRQKARELLRVRGFIK